MEYKLGGTHPQDLASGRMVEPGEKFDLDEEEIDHPHNKALIEDGVLLSVAEMDEPAATEAAQTAAQERGVNLASVEGTGAGGKITKDDVERVAASQETEEGGGS